MLLLRARRTVSPLHSTSRPAAAGIAGFPAIWFPAVGADVLNELLDVVIGQLLRTPSRFLAALDVVEDSALAFFWLLEDSVAC